MTGKYKNIANAYERELYGSFHRNLTDELLGKVHSGHAHAIEKPILSAGVCINNLRRRAEDGEQAKKFIENSHQYVLSTREKIDTEVSDANLKKEFYAAVDIFIVESAALREKYMDQLDGITP